MGEFNLFDVFGQEPGQEDPLTFHVEKPDVLSDGIYDFSVNDAVPDRFLGSDKTPECDSAKVYINIEGIAICERFCYLPEWINKLSAFLTSVGLKQKYDDFTARDIFKAIGRTGKCWITSYEREDGSFGNRVKYFISPKEDLKLIEWREAVKARAGYKCEICGSTEKLEAHHPNPKSEFPELMYNVDNGQCLCRECHKRTHAPRNRRIFL